MCHVPKAEIGLAGGKKSGDLGNPEEFAPGCWGVAGQDLAAGQQFDSTVCTLLSSGLPFLPEAVVQG